MIDQERFQRTLYYESHITQLASQHGVERAADEAAIMVDGASNGMTRIKGPRASAEFAMRLGDRLVGNFDLTTVNKPEKVGEEKVETVSEKTPAKIVVFAPHWGWPIFFGFIIGLAARFF